MAEFLEIRNFLENIDDYIINRNPVSINRPSLSHLFPLFFFERRIEQPILKEMKSENENFMKEKDIKFGLYPLYINWKKIEEKPFENEINIYYNVFKLFGYFGEAVFEILIEAYPKNDYYSHNNFLYELNLLCKKEYKKEEIETNNFYKKLMNIYKDVSSLVKNKVIIFKEIPVFLLIFKIYQLFFSCLKDDKNFVESLKNQFLILSYIKNDEYKKIYKYHLKKIDFPKSKADYINQIKKNYKSVAL